MDFVISSRSVVIDRFGIVALTCFSTDLLLDSWANQFEKISAFWAQDMHACPELFAHSTGVFWPIKLCRRVSLFYARIMRNPNRSPFRLRIVVFSIA